jgi:hypothetical protein
MLLFCLACSALYALFNPLAMVFYPGGTLIDHDAEGYSFLANFFSDLGMTRTYAGEAKVLSLILFATALALMGIALVLFFVIMPGSFTETRLARAISWLGSIGGVVAGFSCIGIAATPWDVHLGAHMVFSRALSVSFLLAVVCYVVAISRSETYANAYAVVLAGYLIILAVYVSLMFLGPGIDTRTGLVIMAAGQKIVIYAGMMCWFAQFLGALAYHRRHSG